MLAAQLQVMTRRARTGQETTVAGVAREQAAAEEVDDMFVGSFPDDDDADMRRATQRDRGDAIDADTGATASHEVRLPAAHG